MNHKFIWIACAVAILSFLIIPMNHAIADKSYKFVKIADGGTSMDISPRLNNSGTVSFYDKVAGHTYGGVYTGSGGMVKTIFEAPNDSFSFNLHHPINNNSAVGYIFAPGWTPPEKHTEILFLKQGNQTTPIVTTTHGEAGYKNLSMEDPAVNDSNWVSFYAELTDGTSITGKGIFVSNGTTDKTIADTNDTFAGVTFDNFMKFTDINNNGWVAFQPSYQTAAQAIYIGNGTTTTKYVSLADGFAGLIAGGIDINSNNVVAFYGLKDDYLTSGIFTSDGTTITEIATAQMLGTEPGKFDIFLGPPALNDRGGVAFLASTVGQTNTGFSIYIHSDSTNSRLIGPGDTFDGKTIDVVSVGRNSLNNSGQLAFYVAFTDQTVAIYRADPPGIGCPWCPAIYLLLELLGG